MLKQNGFLVMITPSIWMRPDRAKMYDYLTRFCITNIHCFSNTETNKLFHGKAQTPTCFFLLTNEPNRTYCTLYDSHTKILNPWPLYRPHLPIPVFASSIFLKLQSFVQKYGHIEVIKTNMPDKNAYYTTAFSLITPYPNVKTCLLNQNQPYLSVNYSSRLLQFANIPKIIMAHKMYGFPFLDLDGKYGISNRDNYVIISKKIGEFRLLQDFLSTRFARYLFEGGRYRMKYLGKYIFELIPDITKFYKQNIKITDNILADLFHLNPVERKCIFEFHKKNYLECMPRKNLSIMYENKAIQKTQKTQKT